jgi:peroxiredoxin-like protein
MREGEIMLDTYFYDTEVGWMGGRTGYLRSSADLPVLEIAAPPEFKGQAHTWTPEHLFVASLNSCYMATFVAIAELSKIELVSFTCSAIGRLEREEGKPYRITEVTLRPRLIVSGTTDLNRAQRLLEKAEKNCFIANSVLTTVKVKAEIELEKDHAAV